MFYQYCRNENYDSTFFRLLFLVYNLVGCLATIDSHKKIGELARQCAVYAQSIFYDGTTQISNTAPLPYGYTNYVKWNDGATGTIINDVVDMIEAMGYARPTFSAYFSKCTQTPLNSNKPIFMGGQGVYGGHAWVVDGYKYYEDVITDHNTEPATVTTSYRYYNHVNWGWYGNSDGYYFDGIFDANNAYSYDNPSMEFRTIRLRIIYGSPQ